MHHLGVQIYFMDTSEFMCQLVHIVRYVAKLASAWITVAITIERFITVAFPLKVTRISTPKIAKLAIGGIWLVSLILGIFPLWTVEVRPVRFIPYTACLVGDMYNIFNWISLRVGSLLVPGLLMMIFTVLIAVCLCRAEEARMRRLSTNSSKSGTLQAYNRVCRLEHQLTVMLLAVAISFILFRLPYTVTFYVKHYENIHFPETDIWRSYRIVFALKITDIFVSLNYASNFFLYCLCGSTFRKQFTKLFQSREVKRRESTVTRMSHVISSLNTSPYSSLGNQMEMQALTCNSSRHSSHGNKADMNNATTQKGSRHGSIGTQHGMPTQTVNRSRHSSVGNQVEMIKLTEQKHKRHSSFDNHMHITKGITVSFERILKVHVNEINCDEHGGQNKSTRPHYLWEY